MQRSVSTRFIRPVSTSLVACSRSRLVSRMAWSMLVSLPSARTQLPRSPNHSVRTTTSYHSYQPRMVRSLKSSLMVGLFADTDWMAAFNVSRSPG